MANKSKKKKKLVGTRDRRGPPQLENEDRRSVAVTVAWMMATLATAAALVLDGIAYAVTRTLGQSNSLGALPGLLLFIAVITGSLTLLLIPVVYRVRLVAPPSTVTIGSLCIAASPWVVLLIVLVR